MIELLPPLGLNKYDTWRILLVKCYIDNYVRLRSCIRNVNKGLTKFPLFHVLCSLLDQLHLKLAIGC
jgi:hypothetical protein